ncbi:MAG: hypothetical protein QOG62_2485 [Thermoleophilaceae bacterium]|jgi:AcrR family transcriptional regulator|nr:hypothetical protein [Thermoleophilaceae bacterium]
MPNGAQTASPPRRSQAERSATTRQALLDAAIECLIEHGYSRTTTAMVAERAGVSRGAHLHHFQTRNALVAGVVEHLVQRRSEQLLELAGDLPPGRAGVERALDLIWEGYDNPLWQAAMDLWTDARTDPELRAILVPIERELDRETAKVAARLMPPSADKEQFARAVELTMATMRGLALLDTLHPGKGRSAKQWPSCRAQLVELFP